MIIPFIDRVRARVDTRERVVSFPPQAVITQDNLTVAIDIVVTFQINDPARAIYGVDNYIVGVEQISVATLRDVVGGMTLEETLTSRDIINRRLRGELDGATTKWGLRISRVELKAIDPPPSIQQSMEMQMKAEREKRAMILTAEGQRESDIRTAEGQKQARILTAEGEKHAAILRAEAERQAAILRAEGERAAKYLQAQGEARAIEKINSAISHSEVTPELLAYQYLEKLPKLAEGQAATTPTNGSKPPPTRKSKPSSPRLTPQPNCLSTTCRRQYPNPARRTVGSRNPNPHITRHHQMVALSSRNTKSRPASSACHPKVGNHQPTACLETPGGGATSQLAFPNRQLPVKNQPKNPHTGQTHSNHHNGGIRRPR